MRGVGGDTLSFSILAMPGHEHLMTLQGYTSQLGEGARLVTIPVSVQAIIA